jgi:hypothetical protein
MPVVYYEENLVQARSILKMKQRATKSEIQMVSIYAT